MTFDKMLPEKWRTLRLSTPISVDSEQPVHPPSMERVPSCPFLDSPRSIEGTCDQRRLWSDCADAQADLSLRWPHKSYCRFCRALAHFCSMWDLTFTTLCAKSVDDKPLILS